ncbi:MAG TPA: pilus assembly protein N-terminal domain-containing protein [Polyangiales bacterium]|nr:pilus assembly protein N-terminal domain-containing protein [Polyangiales bacterium]
MLALLGVLLAPSVRAAAQQSLELSLEVGEQRVLPGENVRSYSEGLPGIVDVRLNREGTSFVVLGQKPGRTSLLLMLRDGGQLAYDITVADSGALSQPTAEPSAVPPRDNVRLDFYFVQLSEDGGLRAGIAWPASLGGGTASAQVDLLTSTITQATAAVTDQALPRLDLAQSAGWAKLLRQAAVITANGSEATFAGGGELNFPVQSALSVGVRQIEFGSLIKVLPRYDRESARIELVIHAEVSDLASDHGSGIPGRTTARLDSVVNLELGQSLVIAGLSARSQGGASNGLPGLSQLPILGPLFGTHERRSEHSENLIFIVPSVVEAVALDARERVREALRAFADYDGELDEHPLRESAPGLRSPRARRPGAGARP